MRIVQVRIVLGANCPGAIWPGANSPGANRPGANCPGGNRPGAICPRANCPSTSWCELGLHASADVAAAYIA